MRGAHGLSRLGLLIALLLSTFGASGARKVLAAPSVERAVSTAAVSTAAVSTARAPGDADVDAPVLWYFWRENCPFCARAKAWLAELSAEHPELVIRSVEVVRDVEGRAVFRRMVSDRGHEASGVPTFILDDRVWVGFAPAVADELAANVRARLAASARPEMRSTVDLGPLGTFDVGQRSMVVATLLIAFVDGFNPCSLWVLTVLLAMILGTRSRARIAAIGGTFLLVTAAIYGLFISGLFTAFVVVGHLGWIQVAVALLALVFGAVNVKDYFAFKQGFSFTIPERFKPRIYRGGRTLRDDRPLLATLAITVGLAGGVALIELPCTAGFPVIWTRLVSEAGVSGAGFLGLLAIYLIVYLLDEIAIVAVAVVTLRASRMQEKHGRVLKLFAGMVMIALALVLLIDPAIMQGLLGSVAVVGAAIAASLLVLLFDRWRASRSA